jgi:hypothetical protein
MKCSEIDEAFAAFNLPAETYKSADGKSKPLPDPVPTSDMDTAETNARKQKLRKMAAVMQAKRLMAARTQMTTDDLAMAFRLASS